jgi:hypothetical protein
MMRDQSWMFSSYLVPAGPNPQRLGHRPIVPLDAAITNMGGFVSDQSDDDGTTFVLKFRRHNDAQIVENVFMDNKLEGDTGALAVSRAPAPAISPANRSSSGIGQLREKNLSQGT